MEKWEKYIEIVTVGADSDPASVNYDYDICVQNNHQSATLRVTVEVIYTFGPELKIVDIAPQQKVHACTVDGGPTIDNCQGVKIIAVEKPSGTSP